MRALSHQDGGNGTSLSTLAGPRPPQDHGLLHRWFGRRPRADGLWPDQRRLLAIVPIPFYAMNDDVLVVATACDGRLKLNLRWFATKKMRQYIVPLLESIRHAQLNIELKDGNLILHLRTIPVFLIEVRPLDGPDRVSFRAEFGLFPTYVRNPTDFFDESMRIYEPMLQVLRGDNVHDNAVGNVREPFSMHRNGKYLIALHEMYDNMGLLIRLYAVGDPSTELVYVHQVATDAIGAKTFYGDGQIIFVLDNLGSFR